MSIDMTTVKQIMHNNKEVIKIEDTNGNTLWEKQGTPSQTSFTLALSSSSSNICSLYTSGSNYTLRLPTRQELLNYIYDNYGIAESSIITLSVRLVMNCTCSGGSSQYSYRPFLTTTTSNAWDHRVLTGTSTKGGTSTPYAEDINEDISALSWQYLYGYYRISAVSNQGYNMASNNIRKYTTSTVNNVVPGCYVVVDYYA